MYTVLRLGLLLATWFLVQLLTPLRGLFAVAVAFVVSGVIGFFLLDRPRNEASVSLSRVFKRIDDRIERAKTAEDDYIDAVAAQRAELATEGEAEPSTSKAAPASTTAVAAEAAEATPGEPS